MKKQDVGKKGRGTARITTSRPQVTDGRKALPAIKRPTHPLTPQEKATWLWYWLGPESKLPVEAADFRIRRSGKTTCYRLNLNKLPEAGIRQTVKDWEARFGKAWGDATSAAHRPED